MPKFSNTYNLYSINLLYQNSSTFKDSKDQKDIYKSSINLNNSNQSF